MRALLARKVDIAWLLLATALSGALLVVWLAMQSASTPGGQVYIEQAAATSVAGHGGAPSRQSGEVTLATPSSTNTVVLPVPAAAKATREVAATPASAAALADVMPTAPTQATGVRIDINRASASELEALPGIGSVLAGRIVRDREANGPFATVDDLDRVGGIGGGIIAKLRDFVTTGP